MNPIMYTWPGSKNKTANAVVSGFFKKRIFVTDYLMENLSRDEIEAIVAHEIGHIKKGHLWIRLGLILGWLLIVQVIGVLGDDLASHVPVWVILTVFAVFMTLYFGPGRRLCSRGHR